VVAKLAPETLLQARVQRRLPDVAERRVAQLVPQAQRRDEVLAQPHRPRNGPRALRDLAPLGQPRAGVAALGGEAHVRHGLSPRRAPWPVRSPETASRCGRTRISGACPTRCTPTRRARSRVRRTRSSRPTPITTPTRATPRTGGTGRTGPTRRTLAPAATAT